MKAGIESYKRTKVNDGMKCISFSLRTFKKFYFSKKINQKKQILCCWHFTSITGALLVFIFPFVSNDTPNLKRVYLAIFKMDYRTN